jgi:hypothetical protein
MSNNIIDSKKIIIDADTREDGRVYLNFSTFSEVTTPSTFELTSILINALTMAVKISTKDMNNKEEGEFVSSVIEHLQNDLFDIDKFKDLEIKEKTWKKEEE